MEINLETELKKEYRNWENWFDQLFNILYSLLWSVGYCLLLATVLIGFSSIFLILLYDGPEVSFVDFQNVFRSIVILCSGISAIAIFVFGFRTQHKFRNVFDDIARNRVDRYTSINNSFYSQVETTESLLLKYNLVTKDQIEKRHSETK